MSEKSFENYGIIAKKELSYTEISGRYLIQKEAERRIVPDIIKKLELSPGDDLLEIGCGPGNLLIPLSFLAKSAVGIDHPNVLSELTSRFKGDSIKKIPGNFLDLEVDNIFSKILIYSVLHYLSDEECVFKFVEKAISLTRPEGIILLGDIPNIDKKRRFLSTQDGQDFESQWNEKMESYESPRIDLEEDEKLIQFNDNLIMKILLNLRKEGLEAYVVPQPNGLPFGRTREDIIIRKLGE